MATEREIDFDGVVNEHLLDKTSLAINEVELLRQQKRVDADEAIEKVTEANSWIKITALGDEEVYNKNRYRVFVRVGRIAIVRGEEIDTDGREVDL